MSGIIYTKPPQAQTQPAGSPTQLQYNAGGGLFGALANVNAINGNLSLSQIATPSTPVGGTGVIYADSGDTDQQLAYVNSYGRVTPIQYGWSHKIVGQILVGNGSLPVGSFDYLGAVTVTGTADSNGSTKTYSAGSVLTNLTRQKITSAAALNSGAEICMADPKRAAIVGSGSQGWGSKLTITFGLATYVTTQRIFVGYSQYASASAYNVDPSTLLNCAAIIKDANDINFSFFFNDGTGAGVKIDTGIAPALNGVYRVTVFIPSNGSSFNVNISQINTDSISPQAAYNQATTNVPLSGQFLYPHMFASTAASTTAVTMTLINLYEEQL